MEECGQRDELLKCFLIKHTHTHTQRVKRSSVQKMTDETHRGALWHLQAQASSTILRETIRQEGAGPKRQTGRAQNRSKVILAVNC